MYNQITRIAIFSQKMENMVIHWLVEDPTLDMNALDKN
jgi:hypothetical protein